MPLVSHAVSSPLNAYIDWLYYLCGPMPYPREKIMPTLWFDLKVNFRGAVQAYEVDHTEPLAVCTESWSMGLWNAFHIVEWPPDVQLFGVCFKPGGAYPFLQIPISELHNRVVSLDEIWGDFAAEIRERLYAVPTVQAGFALLERLLYERLRETPPALAM